MPRKNPLPTPDLKIGARVRIVRERLSLSRAAFAGKIGTDSSMVTNIELGRTPLRYGIALRLLSVFAVNPRWLATGHLPMRFQIQFYGERYQLPPSAVFSKAYEEVLSPIVERVLAAEAERLHCRVEELNAAIESRPSQLTSDSAEAIAERNRRIVQWAENILGFMPPDLHESFLKAITAASDGFFRTHAPAISKYRASLAPSDAEHRKSRRFKK